MDFKNKIKGVILDMDGLMFDTEPFYHKSWAQAAAEQGVELGMDFFKGPGQKQCGFRIHSQTSYRE